MKNTICYIETEKGTYPMVFNLNVMEEIQDKYGSMENRMCAGLKMEL